jgi:hypothetical protein
MTTPSPASRSGAPAPTRGAWRQVALWTVFLLLLAAGLVMAAMDGSAVTAFLDQP